MSDSRPSVVIRRPLEASESNHLGRSDERLEAAVEETERAIAHLELARRLELVVELGRARDLLLLELIQPLNEAVG